MTNHSKKKVDIKELELPETLFVRDIENRVFQGIVLQSLAKIEGISLVEGNFIDSIFNRGAPEGIKGIHAEQDNDNKTVSIKVEINICYGESIPEKAEEIQTKVAEDVTTLTGLHVSSVHVVFKDVVSPEQSNQIAAILKKASENGYLREGSLEEEYSEEF